MSKAESIISSKWTTEMSIGIQFSEVHRRYRYVSN